jgi:hypothetical protein
LELAAASSINAAAVLKKKASRRATCDPGAFSSDLSLFRGLGSSTHAGYRSGSVLEMAREIFLEETSNSMAPIYEDNEASSEASSVATSLFGGNGRDSLISSVSSSSTPSGRSSMAAFFGRDLNTALISRVCKLRILQVNVKI